MILNLKFIFKKKLNGLQSPISLQNWSKKVWVQKFTIFLLKRFKNTFKLQKYSNWSLLKILNPISLQNWSKKVWVQKFTIFLLKRFKNTFKLQNYSNWSLLHWNYRIGRYWDEGNAAMEWVGTGLRAVLL